MVRPIQQPINAQIAGPGPHNNSIASIAAIMLTSTNLRTAVTTSSVRTAFDPRNQLVRQRSSMACALPMPIANTPDSTRLAMVFLVQGAAHGQIDLHRGEQQSDAEER
jgi:hypothetical protein